MYVQLKIVDMYKDSATRLFFSVVQILKNLETNVPNSSG